MTCLKLFGYSNKAIEAEKINNGYDDQDNNDKGPQINKETKFSFFFT